jgi:hypothetical protein
VKAVIANYTVYRGGCIMCMDYNNYSKSGDYFGLVGQFKPIASVLIKKLKDLNSLGFKYENGLLFGFSFGGHLVYEAGRSIGNSTLGEIDSKYVFLNPLQIN